MRSAGPLVAAFTSEVGRRSVFAGDARHGAARTVRMVRAARSVVCGAIGFEGDAGGALSRPRSDRLQAAAAQKRPFGSERRGSAAGTRRRTRASQATHRGDGGPKRTPRDRGGRSCATFFGPTPVIPGALGPDLAGSRQRSGAEVGAAFACFHCTHFFLVNVSDAGPAIYLSIYGVWDPTFR